MISDLSNSYDAEHLFSGSRVEDFLVGPLKNLYFHVQYAGHYICRQSFAINRNYFDSVQLILTLKGEGELHYQERDYHLTPNSIMLIDAKLPHAYHAVSDGWEVKYLHFQGAMSGEYQAYINTKLGPVFLMGQTNFMEIEKLWDSIYHSIEQSGPPDYAAVSANIYLLLTSFLSVKNSVGSAKKSALGIQKAAAYIAENHNRNISTQDIADAAFLSRSYMSMLFFQTYGMSPHEYLIMYRLSRVKEYLMNTTFSVTEIAEQTGFRDVFALSRVFKQKFGVSPSEYRILAQE